MLAIVLSVAILFGFQTLFVPSPPPEAPAPAEQLAGGTGDSPAVPGVSGVDGPGVAISDGDDISAGAPVETPRVPIETGENGRLTGSVALVGARLDDLILTDYREAVPQDSPQITLLSPQGSAHPYFVDFGWTANDRGQAELVPDPKTLWQTANRALTPDQPLTLTWDNGVGLSFARTISVDQNYMFTVTQTVRNTGDEPIDLRPYGLVSRTDEPDTLGFYILHEGPIGAFNGELTELDYEDLREGGTINKSTTGGWIGITDKFWLAALIPDQTEGIEARFVYSKPKGRDKFQVDYLSGTVTVAPGGEAEVTNRLFAGAKEVTLIDGYRDQFNITLFDRAVDFGVFYYLTKPLFYVLHEFNGWFGNFGLAILGLTVIINLIFFPLANKSYVAMSKLKKLQPEMMKLREAYGDDKQKMNSEVMALYKREKANPLAGCLPILIQIPVFFALYKVLFVSIEMRHAPFYGWVKDLSAPDPTSMFNLFGLIPFTPPDFLMIGVWPLLMGFTMFLQQKLNPAPPDPIQARVMMALPVIFIFLFATFPAGLVIYWTWNNVLSIAQQWVIMRRMGVRA
jgi:YidC/Oxa1 family membrane protein insertase